MKPEVDRIKRLYTLNECKNRLGDENSLSRLEAVRGLGDLDNESAVSILYQITSGKRGAFRNMYFNHHDQMEAIRGIVRSPNEPSLEERYAFLKTLTEIKHVNCGGVVMEEPIKLGHRLGDIHQSISDGSGEVEPVALTHYTDFYGNISGGLGELLGARVESSKADWPDYQALVSIWPNANSVLSLHNEIINGIVRLQLKVLKSQINA